MMENSCDDCKHLGECNPEYQPEQGGYYENWEGNTITLVEVPVIMVGMVRGQLKPYYFRI